MIGPNDTTNAVDNYAGSCFAGNLGGRDQVYDFVPTTSGTLTLQTGLDPAMSDVPYCDEGTCQTNFVCPAGCWTKVIYVRTSCADSATEVACNWDETYKNLTAIVAIPVTAGMHYYVFVDSTDASDAGPYYLNAKLIP